MPREPGQYDHNLGQRHRHARRIPESNRWHAPGERRRQTCRGLCRGRALQGVNSTTDISIASQGSITFDALSSSLALQTGGGHGATFTAGTADAGDITFTNPANILSTGGGGLSFQATNATGGALSLGSLSASSFSATATGNIDITSVTATGAITLTSSTGSVSSTGTLQTASQLTLNAAAGITVFTSAVTLEATNSLSGDIAVTQTAPPSQLLTITKRGRRRGEQRTRRSDIDCRR